MFTYNDDSWKSSASIYSPENNELEESSYWLSGTSQRRNGDHLLTQNVFLQAHFGFENCLKLIIFNSWLFFPWVFFTIPHKKETIVYNF